MEKISSGIGFTVVINGNMTITKNESTNSTSGNEPYNSQENETKQIVFNNLELKFNGEGEINVGWKEYIAGIKSIFAGMFGLNKEE
jgi:hypothetical protein